MKVTCSAAKIRAKFDVLGENHGPEILDLQKKMSNEEEVVLEHKEGSGNYWQLQFKWTSMYPAVCWWCYKSQMWTTTS